MKLRSIIPGILILCFVAAAVFVFKTSQSPVSVQEGQADGRTHGPEDAKVTIVTYSDFQCPACQRAAMIAKELSAKYPDDIKVMFKHFPLAMHMWAPLAHQASECALNQGKFWALHDALYETQKQWAGPAHPSEKFFQLAKQAGLNLDQFAACLASPELDPDISADRKKGEELKVNSTPTIFINGERFVGPADFQYKGEALIRNILGLSPLPPQQLPGPQAVDSHAGHNHPPIPVPPAPVLPPAVAAAGTSTPPVQDTVPEPIQASMIPESTDSGSKTQPQQ